MPKTYMRKTQLNMGGGLLVVVNIFYIQS